jgi:transcriptional regulator with XRE-family HTH domain
MDMKLDAKLIRSLREQRAWSQEHLATVAGLGLRTIQRIEKTGAASFESARALAAVLEVDVSDLRLPSGGIPPAQRRGNAPLRPLLGAAAVLFTAGGSLLVATSGYAEQVRLDVGISISDDNKSKTKEWKTQVVVDEGSLVPSVNDVRVEDSLRFAVVPTIEADGRISLATQIFKCEGTDDVLLTAPRLVTGNGEQAEIRFSTEDGKSFRVAITPHLTPLRLSS